MPGRKLLVYLLFVIAVILILISWNRISLATPALVHSHIMAFAVVPYMASGTVSPGFSRFQVTIIMIICRHQIQEPTTSNTAPI